MTRELVTSLSSGPSTLVYSISKPLPPSEQWRYKDKFTPLDHPKLYHPESAGMGSFI